MACRSLAVATVVPAAKLDRVHQLPRAFVYVVYVHQIEAGRSTSTGSTSSSSFGPTGALSPSIRRPLLAPKSPSGPFLCLHGELPRDFPSPSSSLSSLPLAIVADAQPERLLPSLWHAGSHSTCAISLHLSTASCSWSSSGSQHRRPCSSCPLASVPARSSEHAPIPAAP